MTKITLRRHHTAETWASAREEYLLGVSAVEICERHDIGLSTFHRHATRGGWRPTRMSTPVPDPNGLYNPPAPVFDDLDREPQDRWDDPVECKPVDMSDPDEPAFLARLAWIKAREEIFQGRVSSARHWVRLHHDMTAIASARTQALSRAAEDTDPTVRAEISAPQLTASQETPGDEETARDGFPRLVEHRSNPVLDAVEPSAFGPPPILPDPVFPLSLPKALR